MKKKLTRALIDEIRKEMPILTEEEMRYCSGGDGGTPSWDCLFNCMNALNPSKTSQEYIEEFKDIYGLDPKAMGGVPDAMISNVLWNLGFQNTPDNVLKNDSSYEQVVVLRNPDGTGHSVKVIGTVDKKGDFEYYDPTTKNYGLKANVSNVGAVYRIRKSDIYNHDSAGDSNELNGTYGYNYNFTGNDISDYECYLGYDNSRDSWNDYSVYGY